MNSKLILLNGPLNCGKTEVVKALIREYTANFYSAVHRQAYAFAERRCKDKLFKLTQDLFCVTPERFFSIYDNRDLKETALIEFSVNIFEYNKLARFLGKPAIPTKGSEQLDIWLSVREAMIYVSEIVCKPAFGSDYFGVARAKAIGDHEIALDDSCGFADELPPSIDKLGKENVLLIRIRGRGSFEGDSRRFIEDGVVLNTVDVYNTSTEVIFQDAVLEVVRDFLYN